MSHLRVKTKYNTEGIYGSTVEKVLYAHHNNSSDYVIFYDDDGEIIMVVPDTIDNNILDAINKLYAPEENKKLKPDIEFMTIDDMKKCGI